MKTDHMTRIWMIEVRCINPHPLSRNKWSVTGADWYHTRKQCKEAIAELPSDNFEVYEYRAAKYGPQR